MTIRSLFVGVALGRDKSTICYYERETEETALAPMKRGTEDISFRIILDRIEAGPNEEEKEALLEEALDMFRAALLTLGVTDPERQIEGIMICLPSLSKSVIGLVRYIYQGLGINPNRAFVQDRRESLCFFTLYQKEELWNRDVGLFLFEDKKISYMQFHLDRRSRPAAAEVRRGKVVHLLGDKSGWDDQFFSMIEDCFQGELLSSVFLKGSDFDREWAIRSTGLLCRSGRRVYIEDALFARGACFSVQERLLGKRVGSSVKYAGDDMVRYEVGMELEVDGKIVLYPMLQAGMNWYESDYECECIWGGENHLTLQFCQEGVGHRFPVRMDLPDLPERPEGTTRLRLHLSYLSPGELLVEAEDLGFGEISPASGKIWQEIMEVRE